MSEPRTRTKFSYDTSGNMLNDGAHTYGYNAESEIKSAAGVNYTYDGDGNRIEKSSGKAYWYGAGTEILDESDPEREHHQRIRILRREAHRHAQRVERDDLLLRRRHARERGDDGAGGANFGLL